MKKLETPFDCADELRELETSEKALDAPDITKVGVIVTVRDAFGFQRNANLT